MHENFPQVLLTWSSRQIFVGVQAHVCSRTHRNRLKQILSVEGKKTSHKPKFDLEVAAFAANEKMKNIRWKKPNISNVDGEKCCSLRCVGAAQALNTANNENSLDGYINFMKNIFALFFSHIIDYLWKFECSEWFCNPTTLRCCAVERERRRAEKSRATRSWLKGFCWCAHWAQVGNGCTVEFSAGRLAGQAQIELAVFRNAIVWCTISQRARTHSRVEKLSMSLKLLINCLSDFSQPMHHKVLLSFLCAWCQIRMRRQMTRIPPFSMSVMSAPAHLPFFLVWGSLISTS